MNFHLRFVPASALVAILLCGTFVVAQMEPAPQTVPPSEETGAMAGRPADKAPAATAPPTNPPPPDLAEFQATMDRLSRVSQTTVMDLGTLQIQRWKGDRNQKQQAQDHVESLQRNLTAALPELTQKALAAPGDIAPSFRLYRNLNAVYDVLASVTESAGNLGPNDKYERLAADARDLDEIRRSLANRVDTLAGMRDGEIATLRARARGTPQAQGNAPVKKVVVDDTKPPKPPTKKKAAPAVPMPDAAEKQ